MIIGLSEPTAIGRIESINFIKGEEMFLNVPVMVLREATREEYEVERVDVEDGFLARMLRAFPLTRFYDVSMD